MAIDKTTLQIFANYCSAAAESMAYTLVRTAHSTFVKETEDFSCAILTPDGQTFASPKTLGATWYTGLDYKGVLELIDDYQPGDICMTNDPYSGYVATHSPDIVMWMPLFEDGRLICFVAGHIHNTDMGGAVPASLSRTLTEIHQEGIRFPPCKLVSQGTLDESLLHLMAINVRAPEQNRGDIQAQIGMLMTGERRVREMIAHFGLATFESGMHALLDYAEQQARTLVRAMPDGEYFFAEYADEDSVNGKPLRVALNLCIQGDSLVLDYTGSDPQLASSLNIPTGGHERHALMLVGLNYVLYTLSPDILLNAGVYRMVRCILPPGSVVNAQAPAAVGMRSLTCKLTHMLTFGAFSQALPDRLPACSAGGLAIMNVKTLGRDGRQIMASIGPVGGGAGGMADSDGTDASGANNAFLRNTPVEINEAEVPILIRRYCLAPGSGGAGKYRGGLGLVMEFQVFSPGSLVTARNRDRSRFASWGVLGGNAGANALFTRNPDTDKAEVLGNTDLVNCAPGDVIRLVGAGAGGYGDPFERAPERVLRDVRCGYVSLPQAREDYGVAIVDGQVDVPATATLREVPRALASGHFNYGPYRTAFELVWTRERYAALTECLASVPVNWRFFLKHRMFEALQARLLEAPAENAGRTLIKGLFARECAAFPELVGG
ncbi:hydantoinase B/oxoprolinase family protein [Pseudomonas sp. dw_358]|uniref:hydantoinase B/oxoprolinase family protein n=1 Tax=Pseudomonas sp. dw_358 TaxID=2720083 RepID=UPI001BD25982|nr:hydantoinase B/oxoprolinase family protein [Pseudomonas sp. dw_358]